MGMQKMGHHKLANLLQGRGGQGMVSGRPVGWQRIEQISHKIFRHSYIWRLVESFISKNRTGTGH